MLIGWHSNNSGMQEEHVEDITQRAPAILSLGGWMCFPYLTRMCQNHSKSLKFIFSAAKLAFSNLCATVFETYLHLSPMSMFGRDVSSVPFYCPFFFGDSDDDHPQQKLASTSSLIISDHPTKVDPQPKIIKFRLFEVLPQPIPGFCHRNGSRRWLCAPQS